MTINNNFSKYYLEVRKRFNPAISQKCDRDSIEIFCQNNKFGALVVVHFWPQIENLSKIAKFWREVNLNSK